MTSKSSYSESTQIGRDLTGFVSWPSHGHLLYLCDTGTLPAYVGGNFICDNCKSSFPRSYAYHCSTCNYDVCQACFNGFTSVPSPMPVYPTAPPIPSNQGRICSHHSHPLYCVDPRATYPLLEGCWVCNRCQSKGYPSTTLYHCSLCNFDLCDSCINTRQPIIQPILQPILQPIIRPVVNSPRLNAYYTSKHTHPLYLSDPRMTYPTCSGSWICDYCRKNGSPASVMYHCDLCDYDLCDSCLRPSPTPPSPYAYHTVHHPHALYLADPVITYPFSSGSWTCGRCRRSGQSSSTMFHCSSCNFDLCNVCLRNIPSTKAPR